MARRSSTPKPRMRLFGKQKPDDPRMLTVTKQQKQANKRKAAIAQGLVPKARRGFALFVMDHSKVPAGATKQEHIAAMQAMSKEWKKMTEEQKAVFKARSAQEFQSQRDALMRLGLSARTLRGQTKDPCAKSQTSIEPGAFADIGDDGVGEKFHIGSFVVHSGSSASVLGGGSYGKVFAASCAQGRLCAVKVFRSRHAEEEAKIEIEKYKNLSQLPATHRRWYPELLDFDASGQPWPYMALSFAGSSLSKLLSTEGPFPADLVPGIGLQLQAAIQVMHEKARLLHLDVKPGNVLYCKELKALQLCDLGMCEALHKPTVQGPKSMMMALVVPEPRFSEYVTDWYRPPELWNLSEGLLPLQQALTPAVDLWSFGCVMFEVASGKPLFRPRDGRWSAKHAVAEWCQYWTEIKGQGQTSRLQGNASRYWSSRLAACDMLRGVVLRACCPEPKARTWMNKRS